MDISDGFHDESGTINYPQILGEILVKRRDN